MRIWRVFFCPPFRLATKLRNVPVPYAKPSLTTDQQLAKLQSRGLLISALADARSWLERTSYYRLSGYWHWLRDPATGRFRSGATFDEALRLYEFDRRLRLIVLSGMERVEVMVRAAITQVMAHKFGAFAHCNPSAFRPSFDHQRWNDTLDKETSRATETFLQHFRAKYLGFPRIPIWMATEVATFGSLSVLIKEGLLPDEARAVSARLGVHPALAPSWIHALSVLRNICAHQGRIWNRHFGVRPRLPNDSLWVGVHHARVYALLRVIRHLTLRFDAGLWWSEASKLLRETNGHAAMQTSMNLPSDWESRLM